VQSDYFSKKNLASTAVDTPDPHKDIAYFGQRILIDWYIPLSTFNKNPCTLHIDYRLRNAEEENQVLEITKPIGSYTFLIKDEDYSKKGGLLSYLITIQQEKNIVAESRHKFWMNKIHVE